MKLHVDIMRFDPRSGKSPALQRFEVEADPTDRVLDVLLNIKSAQDATLSFRYSCAHGVCGSDAMRINGKERLACKTLVRAVTGDAEGAATEDGAAADPEDGAAADPEDGAAVIRWSHSVTSPCSVTSSWTRRTSSAARGRSRRTSSLRRTPPPRERRDHPDTPAAGAVRGRHEVHQLRRLFLRVPRAGKEPALPRSRCHRPGGALRGRQPRLGSRSPPGRAGRPGRHLGLREPFRVHAGLSPRDQGHEAHQPHEAQGHPGAPEARRDRARGAQKGA